MPTKSLLAGAEDGFPMDLLCSIDSRTAPVSSIPHWHPLEASARPIRVTQSAMKIAHCYDAEVAGICDSLSQEKKTLLQWTLDNGFDDEAAQQFFDEGVAEEQRSGASEAADYLGLRFVPSSLQDLELFVNKPEIKDELNQALRDLPSKLGTPSCVPVLEGNGWVLREGPYRIVFRVDSASGCPIVLGIAVWARNPMLKVWRYLDQEKAEDLARTSELYFRRLDLLEDEYEGTQTQERFLNLRAVFGPPFLTESHPARGESVKQRTYVCCWRRSPHESWFAWKQYCPQGGGFALQTTSRKLMHLHARLRQSGDIHCRDVVYIDHCRDEFEYSGPEEGVFYKALWFSDEREIRLVRFDRETWCMPPEKPDHRMKCDLSSLVDSIVINPFATEEQRAALTKLIETDRRELLVKLQESEIARPPVGQKSDGHQRRADRAKPTTPCQS